MDEAKQQAGTRGVLAPGRVPQAAVADAAASSSDTTNILVRKRLRRGSVTSKVHLKPRIEAFIAYFNRTMAKPFGWAMKGRPFAV
jgi:hypothetical protein